MAYLGIVASQFIPNGNYITVNGSDPIRVNNGYYKLPSDRYTVVVHGADGQAWECEADVRDHGTRTACLSIRLAQDKDGNIAGMEYAVYDMNSTQEFGAMSVAKKLKLSYTGSKDSASKSADDDAAWLEEKMNAEDFTGTSLSSDDTGAVAVPRKKGGTGWIVFGIICLLAAAVTAETAASVAACGVLGIICLIVGIKKKKS